MISFLEGTIEHLGDKFVILNAGGVGYRLTVVPKLVNILSKINSSVKDEVDSGSGRGSTAKPTIKLFVHSQMNPREGTFDLYGFQKPVELEIFNMLKSVSGIGPKSAIHILSVVEPGHLKAAVLNDDADYLKKVSGLGPKTAHRLILELKNKVDYLDIIGDGNVDLNQESQALDALMSLGYSFSVAKSALKEVKADTLQGRVKETLKILSKK